MKQSECAALRRVKKEIGDALWDWALFYGMTPEDLAYELHVSVPQRGQSDEP